MAPGLNLENLSQSGNNSRLKTMGYTKLGGEYRKLVSEASQLANCLLLFWLSLNRYHSRKKLVYR